MVHRSRRGRTGRVADVARTVLALALTACGPSGSEPGPTPTATPVPTPSATAGPPAHIAAMALGVPGQVTSVNAREWIAVVDHFINPDVGRIVLPPDAGPDAGPLPVPGCPLFDRPPGCVATAYGKVVAETDWIYGDYIVVTPSQFEIPVQAAIGPQGEVIDLVGFGIGEVVDEVVPGPGPIFFGTIGFERRSPVYWPTPGLERAALPGDGFTRGPVPRAASETQRIVGGGIEPQLPVLWSPSDGGYRIETLPLLEGGTAGGATDIAGDVISGWSDDGTGTARAVVWVPAEAGFAVRALPVPEEAAACTRAVAVSELRVAGDCSIPGGAPLAVVWSSGDGGASWRVTQLLDPLSAGNEAHAVDISEYLVVGESRNTGTGFGRPVAWRLPSPIRRQ